jgi:hypothetical protein
MTEEFTRTLGRLAAAGIELLPAELSRHYVLTRDGFVCLVERAEDGFGDTGAPGLMTDRGFAALVWRGEDAWFVARGFEQRASAEQVEQARAFSADLHKALHPDLDTIE